VFLVFEKLKPGFQCAQEKYVGSRVGDIVGIFHGIGSPGAGQGMIVAGSVFVPDGLGGVHGHHAGDPTGAG